MPPLTRRSVLASPSLAALPSLALQAPPERRLLSSAWNAARLSSALLPRDGWRLYPPYEDRAAWSAPPADAREQTVAAGARQLGEPWPSLPATLFLEFRREGNRSRYEALRGARRNRLRELVAAECVEGKGRFLDEIVNGIWLTCEETWWGVPAHVGVQKAGNDLPDAAEPIVDLFAADTGSLLSWTSRLLGAALDKVSPLVRPRISLEVKRRILDPCHERTDFWWMGLDPALGRAMNNWNPWINSNWLTCVMLEEIDPQRRAADVYKILTSLDRFIDSYHDDGGCDEGPSYWGHAGGSLFECLELLYSATSGKVDFYALPIVREIGAYIYRAHIAGDWYTNFADAPPRFAIAADLVYRYGRRVKDTKMMAQGAYAASIQKGARAGTSGLARELDALFNLAELRKAEARPPLVRDVWLSGTQVMAARLKEGSTDGLYLAAQGGRNAESHNHNDVGNFIVFANGEPVLIDAGVETYTAKTFSPRRYEIWTMRSSYHNTPTINGVEQAAGRQYAARDVKYQSGDGAAELSMEISAAYPEKAGVLSWRRTWRFDRSKNAVFVAEKWVIRAQNGSFELNLMTPCEVRRSAAGQLELAGRARLHFDARLAVEIDEIKVDDARLAPVWGGVLRRIRLIDRSAPQQGETTLRVEQIP
jgi:hypothetical protein